MKITVKFATRSVLAAAVCAAAIGGAAWDGLAAVRSAVSQRARMFQPNRLELNRGDTIGLLNDDGELLHHAYVAGGEFAFDSGEQQPGSTVDIRFTKPGSYMVLCRIHPKMSLAVNVK